MSGIETKRLVASGFSEKNEALHSSALKLRKYIKKCIQKRKVKNGLRMKRIGNMVCFQPISGECSHSAPPVNRRISGGIKWEH